MHHMHSNEMHGEKARLELSINAMSCFERILEAAPHQTAITHLPSQKNCQLDEDDKVSTAGW